MLGQLLYALHVLGAVLWVGGMAFALLALRPALLLTGGALMFFWYGGFRGSGWHVHFMFTTGLIMAAVFAALFFGPWRRFRAARGGGDLPGAAASADKVRRLVA